MTATVTIERLRAERDALAAILRDIRPLLDGMRGEMPEGLGRRVMGTLLARIDKALPADSASPSHAPLIGHCARCGVGLYGGSEGECFTVCTPCYEAERATQTVSEEQR
jgi:hypothetical protein